MNKFGLLDEIEQCRNKMVTLSFTHDLTSEVVIQSSEQLDRLINEYQKETVNA